MEAEQLLHLLVSVLIFFIIFKFINLNPDNFLSFSFGL